jgi:hypothetical protein
MKNVFCIILLAVVISFSANAQTEQSTEIIKKNFIGVGAYLMTKSAVSIRVEDGYKNKPVYLPLGEIGISSYYLFQEKYGVVLNLGLSSSGFAVYPYGANNADESATTITYSRFVINPLIYLRGLVVGITYPLSVSRDIDGYTYPKAVYPEKSVLELNIGGMIPIYEDDNHLVNINILGSYPIDEIQYKGQPMSLSLGMSYYFKATKF